MVVDEDEDELVLLDDFLPLTEAMPAEPGTDVDPLKFVETCRSTASPFDFSDAMIQRL